MSRKPAFKAGFPICITVAPGGERPHLSVTVVCLQCWLSRVKELACESTSRLGLHGNQQFEQTLTYAF